MIVIDESHNFRNGGRFDNEDEDDDFKENRYARLMNKVIRSGVKTKVLMLSATPVNNRFSDLKNQLQLAYEGKSENINDLLDRVSVVYATENKEIAEEKIKELSEKYPEKFYMVYSVPLNVDLTTLSHYPSIEISQEDLQ